MTEDVERKEEVIVIVMKSDGTLSKLLIPFSKWEKPRSRCFVVLSTRRMEHPYNLVYFSTDTFQDISQYVFIFRNNNSWI